LNLGERRWPPWWDWELEISPHLVKRMFDRRFTEIDLRRMLEYANGYHRDIVQGRWVILTTYQRSRWEVIVEPDFDSQLLVVVVTLQQRGTMKDSYLEVTFRRGRPLAAYY